MTDSGHRQRFGAALLAFLLGAAALAPAVPAAAAGAQIAASEERVQAAYLHKFLNYADWPPGAFPQPDTPYVIGVAGDDAVADELARIAAGRSVNNRGVIVKRLLPGDTVNDLHMLYVGRNERARLGQWLRQAKGRPILTVSAADGALDLGSIINFRTVDDRVRFEVSVDMAEQSGLRLNSRLFSVATNVVKGKS
ncbi:YfiR family protein [Massilia aerilata]|uniref:YfiR family protein n=1 Tax=Massilia aerilata TaxID=453817 RepID=A0ABW0RUK8_9BURK